MNHTAELALSFIAGASSYLTIRLIYLITISLFK